MGNISSDLESTQLDTGGHVFHLANTGGHVFYLANVRGALQIHDSSQPPQQPADEPAYRCLVAESVSYKDVHDIVQALESSDLSGRSVLGADGLLSRAFTTGAFVRAGVAGLHVAARTYPWLTCVLTCVVRLQFPGLTFSSVSLISNCQTSLHRDSHNHGSICNAVTPASAFEGGQLWVESPRGQTAVDGLLGHALEIKLPGNNSTPENGIQLCPGWAVDESLWHIIYVRHGG